MLDFSFNKLDLSAKSRESTGMDNCNGFPTPTNVEANLGTYDNGSEAKRYLTK